MEDAGSLDGALDRARALLESGDLDGARRALDGVCFVLRAAGRRPEESVAACAAARLCRLQGQLELAEERARAALRAASSHEALISAAEAEMGEIARARGDNRRALSSVDRALGAAGAAGLDDGWVVPLLSRRSELLAAEGRTEEAAVVLDEIGRRMDAEEWPIGPVEDDEVRQALVTALGVLAGEHQRAAAAHDPVQRVRIETLAGARLVLTGDLEGALAAADNARRAAVDAGDPLAYVGAAAAAAHLAEAAGDRVKAYELLARGWVTVRAWVSEEAADAAFKSLLADQRARWGEDGLAAVKADSRARRGIA